MSRASLYRCLMAAGIAALTACTSGAPRTVNPAQGGGGEPPSAPPPTAQQPAETPTPQQPAETPTPQQPAETPTPQQPAEMSADEMSWTISAADFGDETDLWTATSNRSALYAWERITGDAAGVSISIGEHEIWSGGNARPLENTRVQPIFESDPYGATWTVTPEVRDGAVVLVLTAEDHTEDEDYVESVYIADRGTGYTGTETVTFSDPQAASGTTATGTLTKQSGVASVTIGSSGLGYPAFDLPVTFTAPPVGGRMATGTARRKGGIGTLIMTQGSGYSASNPPILTFPPPPPGGTLPIIKLTINASGFLGGIHYDPMQSPSCPSCRRGSGYISLSRHDITVSGGDGTDIRINSVFLQTDIGSVTITDAGSGYTTAPDVTFSAPPGFGTTATGTAVLQSGVQEVTVTNRGSGYSSPPTVTFLTPTGGTAATGIAKLGDSGYSQSLNLSFARQVLDGKQLRVRIAGQ